LPGAAGGHRTAAFLEAFGFSAAAKGLTPLPTATGRELSSIRITISTIIAEFNNYLYFLYYFLYYIVSIHFSIQSQFNLKSITTNHLIPPQRSQTPQAARLRRPYATPRRIGLGEAGPNSRRSEVPK
jgi:hypothetical protein